MSKLSTFNSQLIPTFIAMCRLKYLSFLVFLYACSPVIISVKQDVASLSLEEMENPHRLETKKRNDSNYTALAMNSGMYRIGEYQIDMSKFKDVKSADRKYSFAAGLTYVALIRVNGSDAMGDELRYDTTILFGSKPSTFVSADKAMDPTPWKFKLFNEGFGNDCPPGVCTHYFIAINSMNQLITAMNLEQLKNIIPVIKQPADAVLFVRQDIANIDGKYAKTKDGFLVLVNRTISECPIDYADILFHVSMNGELKQLGMVITKKTVLCH
jgi:hypothetical protein